MESREPIGWLGRARVFGRLAGMCSDFYFSTAPGCRRRIVLTGGQGLRRDLGPWDDARAARLPRNGASQRMDRESEGERGFGGLTLKRWGRGGWARILGLRFTQIRLKSHSVSRSPLCKSHQSYRSHFSFSRRSSCETAPDGGRRSDEERIFREGPIAWDRVARFGHQARTEPPITLMDTNGGGFSIQWISTTKRNLTFSGLLVSKVS